EIDILDLSPSATPAVVNLGAGRFTGIETVIGNNVDSTLIGADTPNTWTITGANDGTVNRLRFVDFNNLAGGSGVDTFSFTAADERVAITGDDEPVGEDEPEDEGSGGGEEELERRVFGLPAMDGDLLARALARQPGVDASVTEVDGVAVLTDATTVV